jgi:hypothetical protein
MSHPVAVNADPPLRIPCFMEIQAASVKETSVRRQITDIVSSLYGHFERPR